MGTLPARDGHAAVKSDHWFFSIFQSAPDLIALLLPAPGSDADLPNPASGLEPEAPGDRLYRFDSPELKDVNHRLDGLLWPRRNGNGTAERPVVLLEVQMQSDPAFHHRLAAQTYRFLQKHPHVEHWAPPFPCGSSSSSRWPG